MASSSSSDPVPVQVPNDEVDEARLFSLVKQGLASGIIHDQLESKTCKVFAQLASVEAAYNKHGAKHQLYNLSAQQVVDADPGPLGGRTGGPMSLERSLAVLPYVTTEENYKSDNLEKQPFNKEKMKAPLVGVLSFPQVGDPANNYFGSESKYTQLLDEGNVICVGVFADKDWDKHQKGTVYRGPDAPRRRTLNHCVAIVGYGYTKGGEKFWLCKNSHGVGFGEKGYIRIGVGGGPYGYAGIYREGQTTELMYGEENWERDCAFKVSRMP